MYQHDSGNWASDYENVQFLSETNNNYRWSHWGCNTFSWFLLQQFNLVSQNANDVLPRHLVYLTQNKEKLIKEQEATALRESSSLCILKIEKK